MEAKIAHKHKEAMAAKLYWTSLGGRTPASMLCCTS
jgi:hypothetical protein